MGLFNHWQKGIFSRWKWEQRRVCEQLDARGTGMRLWAFTWFNGNPESPALEGRVASPPSPVTSGGLLHINLCSWGSWGSPGPSRVLPVLPHAPRVWGSPKLFKVLFYFLFFFKGKKLRLRSVEAHVRSSKKCSIQAPRITWSCSGRPFAFELGGK